MDMYIALFQEVAKPLLACLVTAIALVGILGLVSPRWFSRVLAVSNYSIDTQKILRIPDNRFFQFTDKWFDIDGRVACYGRLAGSGMLLASTILGLLYFMR